MDETAFTRKQVRLWHQALLRELQHQYDNAHLFAADAEDEEQMKAGLFQEWCARNTAAKMEMPPSRVAAYL